MTALIVACLAAASAVAGLASGACTTWQAWSLVAVLVAAAAVIGIQTARLLP
ncbi:hypothetical protein [Prescottella equi]|uniref:hypothetical protein n=1 Tax=Rhodococcus hoagii TaxID=43767 RepID=UPI001585BAFD|nr:hypothetical protein [Prescottella equi]